MTARQAQRGADRQREVARSGFSSITRGVADALIIKDGDLVFLSDPDGEVPIERGHGLGLYYRDCRYLRGYVLDVAGERPEVLVGDASRGFRSVLELTNPEIEGADGRVIHRQALGVRWTRTLDTEGPALRDRFLVRSFSLERLVFDLTFHLRAAFEDVYIVRLRVEEPPGRLHDPVWSEGTLRFAYDGTDARRRGLAVRFDPSPDAAEGASARFRVALGPRGTARLAADVLLEESEAVERPRPALPLAPIEGVEARLERAEGEWLTEHTRVRTDSVLLDRVVERALRDLHVLRSTMDGHEFFAAGIPWFVALFGRDSLVTALETLAFRPDVARPTLRLLARHQGERLDEWREEEPGKILHERRVGELARVGDVPYARYYGTVDATPLFLVLLARYADWTGDLDLALELGDHVERALRWMREYGDGDGDGYLDYRPHSERGLTNLGWKDSSDAVVNADGSRAVPPIALVEVQAYAYLARRGMARLYRRAGDEARAERLSREAEQIGRRFAADFWDDDLGTYVLARQAGGRPAAVVTSNPAHALWAGIADPERARLTARRLLADDMFSGWGIRTLSERERRYNPIGYHVGTVWPHDNAIAAAGFRRYGLDEAAARVAEGVLEAAMRMPDHRLPEALAGFRRVDYPVPVGFPVACRPQAWAAGAVPFLLETLLGLVPDAFARCLRVVRPQLPRPARRLELRRLRVGQARVDLAFERTGGGAVAVEVLGVEGDLEVVVEPQVPGGER